MFIHSKFLKDILANILTHTYIALSLSYTSGRKVYTFYYSHFIYNMKLYFEELTTNCDTTNVYIIGNVYL